MRYLSWIVRIVGVVALVSAIAGLFVGPAEADALSDGRFRAEVMQIVRTIRPNAEIVPDPDPLQIRVGPRTVALTNLYGRVNGLTASERRQKIEEFFSSLLAAELRQGCCTTQAYAEARKRLRVQLLPREVFAEHPELVSRPFSDTLNVVYVLDEPKRYQYVTKDMLAGWGVDAAAVEAVAVKNLSDASSDVAVDLAVTNGRPSYILSHSGDDYDAARLMLPHFLEELRRNLKTDAIVVTGPTRGLLMAWPAAARERIAYAVTSTKLMREGPYGRSDELFRFDANGLRPLNAAERAEHGRRQ